MFFNLFELCCSSSYVIILLVLIFIIRKIYSSREVNVNDKYVLITGCDSGFGYFASLFLNNKEVNVLCACLTEEGIKRLEEDDNFKGTAFKLDVTNQNDIDNAYEMIKKKVKGKGLWCLINNAGIFKPGPIEWQSTAVMRRTMDVNLWGAVDLTKKMLPLIKESKGRIVNLISMAGRTTLGQGSSYSMSKYAFESFSDGLRYEMNPWDVSVHIIEPGMFSTNIVSLGNMKRQWNDLWNEQEDEMKHMYGEHYLQGSLANYYSLISILSSKDIHKVVKAIAHAALSTNPNKRYVVGVDANTLWILLTYLPTCIGDFINNNIAKLPTPKQMQK